MKRKFIKKISFVVIISSLLYGCGASDSKTESKGIITNEMQSIQTDEAYDSNMSYSTENFNTEEYNTIEENGYKSVLNNPISTFSVDVDTASYSNVRRMINNGLEVEKDAVRIEEMINYFKYDYDEPKGDLPFSINTELSDCPWNENTKLLSIGLKAKDIDYNSLPKSNLVFLIDVSGSMYSEDKLPLVQRAFLMLTENLREEDRISIVTYASGDAVVLEGASGSEKIKITDSINSLIAGGSTAGSKGIETAYKIAEKYFIKGGNNRVILATDGDLNVGITSEGDLKRLIEEKKKSGIHLSVLGFGSGNIKDNKMEALADNGDGNYNYIDSALEAKKVLIEEMGGTLFTVAKDVKLQLEFNPSQVKGYRLVGYENRLLNTEDFDDDTKDAGDIGAGHRVTALYEIALKDSKQEIPETDLKYQETTTNESDELVTINLRYKKPDENKSNLESKTLSLKDYNSKMSDNLEFSSSVAEFGMLLRDSKYKGNSSYEGIYNKLSNKKYIEEDEYKKEFLELVKKCNDSLQD
ncbi:MAG: VWA domain-containing protein [Clostridium sp.]|nr:VWA domain-containing protein [Clostridium sp.]